MTPLERLTRAVGRLDGWCGARHRPLRWLACPSLHADGVFLVVEFERTLDAGDAAELTVLELPDGLEGFLDGTAFGLAVVGQTTDGRSAWVSIMRRNAALN